MAVPKLQEQREEQKIVEVNAKEGSVHMDDEDFSSDSDMNANQVPQLGFSAPHNMQGDTTNRTKGGKFEEDNPFKSPTPRK